ncbi:MAG: hypothetical protein A3A81_03845 [Omnitrophica bacterium RIFCSPLOWO2_01_FULL_45_10b]|nr:MAG: hypothetical protein A3A81_03845 [Omnitrophica bacterium RIFCSPLOWO2_01_FULL_45_10b]
MNWNRVFKNPIFVLGALILLTQIGVSWVSKSFVFGVGHAERPIILFLILEFISFGFYFSALEWVRRLPREFGSNRRAVFWILLIGLLCRIAFLPSNLIQETDPYRYVWDGQTVLKGENPYEHSPKEAFWNQRVPGEKAAPEIIETFQRINHAGIKTIYPPLAQMLFAVSQFLSPWKLDSWRFMILLAEVGILMTLAFSLRKLGLRQEWILLYAWSPLVLKEFSNSLHLDVFAVLFLTLTVWAAIRRRILWAFAFLALASGIKLFPIALMPLLCVWIWAIAPKEVVKGSLLFGAILTGFYLPFASAGSSLFEGLGRFAGEWQVNAGIFGFIKTWFLGMRPFASHAEWLSRTTVSVLFVALTIQTIQWLKFRENVEAFLKASLVVIAGLFFLAPTGNPWYFTWVFPFLAFTPSRALILFSGLAFLYYLDFYFEYQGMRQAFSFVKLFEYGVFYLTLGWELCVKKQALPSLFRWSTKKILLPTR